MALLLAGDAQVECVSYLERVAAGSPIVMIHRIQVFSDEVGFKPPPQAEVRHLAHILNFVRSVTNFAIINGKAVAVSVEIAGCKCGVVS